MGKRKSYAPEGDGQRKRIRVAHDAPTSEEVNTARQLQQLLAFDQDVRKTRHGLQSFKLFLDKLSDPEKREPDRLEILKSYLTSSPPRNRRKSGDEGDDGGGEEEEVVYLPDIMDTWHFGAQVNNEQIMSAVPVVLGLLLRILSQILDLVPVGRGICRTLLLKQQQELIGRNLSADKGKEFLISPTLRLLREAVCFDGGVMARPIFRARAVTFKALARNMGLRFLGEGLEEAKRASVRTNAVRFFMSSLKFLHTEARAELLSQRDLVAALMKGLKEDPPHLIVEILDGLKSSALKDQKLSRQAKSKLLHSTTLGRIASLYGYAQPLTEDGSQTSVSDVAHEFLLYACTSLEAGVLKEQTGFYPRGVELEGEGSPAAANLGDPNGAIGLDRIAWMDKFTAEVPVHNTALAEFIQGLRPWSSAQQSELLVAIFAAAPELVARYFIDKRSFTFEPKLSVTWIGYAALIFNTIQISLPPCFGNKSGYAHVPPPTSIIVDNIMPLPLTQKTLSRCLLQKSKLVSFFATRLLVIAMRKLKTALELHEEASRLNKKLWSESASRLVDEFCQRCPGMKDVINTYRGIPQDDLLSCEAASRALRLYYEVVPQVALLARFDVSPFLVTALQQVEKQSHTAQDRALAMMELENLLAIAGYSPGMRWFSKADGLSLSPFVTLLKVCVEAPEGLALGKLSEVLDFVFKEQQLVVPGEKQQGSGLQALIRSLQSLREGKSRSSSLPAVWSFLDNCIVRCANSPIKYLDMMEELSRKALGDAEAAPPSAIVDPITIAMMEQLPFATAQADKDTLGGLASFLSRYLECSTEDSSGLLKLVREKLGGAFPEGSKARARLAVPAKARHHNKPAHRATGPESIEPGSKDAEDAGEGLGIDESRVLEGLLDVPLPLVDNSALSRWVPKAADELVEDGYAKSLITLLSSPHISIRKEAVVNILKMAAKIQDSTYDEKEQVWLLLSELAESAREPVEEGPLPSQMTAFACHALEVLGNPLHCLYAKVNTFLTSRPVWSPDRFPLVSEILQGGPTEDDSYYSEVSWALAYLLDSLRTPADLSLFHGRRLFEKLMSLAANPYMRQPLRMQLYKIIYRATSIEGGSTTLVTRFGAVSWLEERTHAAGSSSSSSSSFREEGSICRALMRRIWDTCDQARVSGWSRQGLERCMRLN